MVKIAPVMDASPHAPQHAAVLLAAASVMDAVEKLAKDNRSRIVRETAEISALPKKCELRVCARIGRQKTDGTINLAHLRRMTHFDLTVGATIVNAIADVFDTATDTALKCFVTSEVEGEPDGARDVYLVFRIVFVHLENV